MILLDKKEYNKVIRPLKEVTINNLFARSVIEQKVDGLAYVDDDKMPTTFYIVHPYTITPKNLVFLARKSSSDLI